MNGSGNGAITVALKMFNALVHSDASAYIYWQFADESSSATQHNLLGQSNLDNPLSSNKYVAFNHFSRFVRPGAVRIESTFTDGETSSGGASEYDTLNSVNVSSFLHEEDGTLTYVLLNLTGSGELITIDLPSTLEVGDFQYFRSSETEQFTQLANLTSNDGQLSFTMPRYSLVTLVGAIADTPSVLGDYDGNGVVNAQDFVYYKNAFGTTDLAADGNRDGVVNLADYVVWRDNLGGEGVASYVSQAVPEPTAVVITSAFVAFVFPRWTTWMR